MVLERYSLPLLRIALSIVFLYFGYQQITDGAAWTGFVPVFATQFGLAALQLVSMNAILELVLGTFLFIGLYTRFSALILSLHLFGISFSLGLNPLGMRDFGLACATFAIFLAGADEFCLDSHL